MRKAIELLILDEKNVLVCIGSRPCSSGLGLDTLGIEPDPRGLIMADERMEIRAPWVYAIGDVLGPSKPATR